MSDTRIAPYVLQPGAGRSFDLGAFRMSVKASAEAPAGQFSFRESRCPAGSFIFIPAGIPHGFRVGSVASRKLTLYAPAAMVGYFDELAEATKRGDLDPAGLADVARRYSMEVIGPVPEGYL